MSKTLAPSKASKVTDRDPKGLKFMSIVGTAYSKVCLTEEEAQRVNDASGLNDLIADFIAEHRHTDKFKNEEVKSSFGYLSGYNKPAGLTQQANHLRALGLASGFTNMDYQAKIEKGEVALPDGAEGWFAIPNWIKNPKIFGTTYSQAVQRVLDEIKKTPRNGRFYNYREGQITEKQLRQSKRTEQYFAELSKAQGDPDILIVPAQFGLRHRGRSVRRAREVMTGTQGEFGLGAFAVGIMLLTHTERLKHVDDLWIDCAGDEFDDPGSAVRFDRAPYFRFGGGGVKFDAMWFSFARGGYGSASGFLSQ